MLLRLFTSTAVLSILPAAVMATAAHPPVAATPLARPNQRCWAAAILVETHGVRLRVRTDDAALVAGLQTRLPPCSHAIATDTVDVDYSITTRDHSAAAGDESAVYDGLAGVAPFAQAVDAATLLEAFESKVRFDVAVAAREWVFVHAGVVAWTGAAIVVPAPSMHGKSRLVDALVRAGASYYSDEFAVIDASGLVHPFRIPLSLRTESGGARRVMVSGADHAPALPIRLVASTGYVQGAEWCPRRGTRAEAMLALCANTVRVRLAPHQTLSVLARAVEQAVMLEGPRGEADRVASLLLEACL